MTTNHRLREQWQEQYGSIDTGKITAGSHAQESERDWQYAERIFKAQREFNNAIADARLRGLLVDLETIPGGETFGYPTGPEIIIAKVVRPMTEPKRKPTPAEQRLALEKKQKQADAMNKQARSERVAVAVKWAIGLTVVALAFAAGLIAANTSKW